MNHDEIELEILDGLTRLIRSTERTLRSEEKYPMGDADASDDKIAALKKRRSALREARALIEGLEND